MLTPAFLAVALVAPSVELYTMGQSEHLFERFGHAALCVIPDAAPHRARCYNYGTADFGSPPEEMGWDFVRGTSRFWVSVAPRARMLRNYERADRSIWKQTLRLTPEQARAVEGALTHDALPENREYLYHHFHDNCATRLRDLIDRATDGALSRDTGPSERTFREYGRDALAGVPLALIAGDLFVGRRADARPTRYEAMFLPDVLRREVATRLSAPATLVYARRGPSFEERAGATWPYWVALAVLTAAPLAIVRRALLTKVGPRLAIATTGLLLGILGTAVWLVSWASTVPELRENEALAVFLPSDLFLVALPDTWRRRYARFRLFGLTLVSTLLALDVLRQPLFAAVLVVALPMALLAFPARARNDPASAPAASQG